MKGRKRRIWKLILGAAVVLTMLPVRANAGSASEVVSGEFTITVSDFKENDQLIENNPQVTAKETTITYLGDGNYTLSYQMDIAAADGTYRMPEKAETAFQWASCLEPLSVQIPQTSSKADQTQTEGYSWVLTITRAANTEHTLENREKASNCTHQGYEKDGCIRCAYGENVSLKDLDPDKHDYTWQTDEDGHQMHICSYNAEHNGTCSGGEEATCTEKSICSTCRNAYGRYAHELVYTAAGSVITESCTKNCDHSASAELILDSEVSRIYSGSEIDPLAIQYSGDWEGGELTIQYQDNVDATTETKKALGRISAGENAIAEKTFDIEKASLKITADDQNCFYGDPVPAFTAKTEGLIMGESSADAIQGTPVFTCAYTPESPVGSYTIKADISGLSADNYTVTAVDGTLSVAQRELTIQWGNTEFLYDEASHVPAATVGNTVNGDVITLNVSGETAEAGEHEAVVTGFSGDNQDNYKLPENLQIRFSILCAAPSSPAAQGETILNKGDGKITGVDNTMAYRAETETGYHSISGTEVINLKAGKYLVRTKAADGKPASYAKEVTVEAGTPLTISIPAEQKGYTLTVDPAQVGWNDSAVLTFTLEESTYIRTPDFAVKANDGKLSQNADGTYTISKIQEHQTVTVEGVEPAITMELMGQMYHTVLDAVTFDQYTNSNETLTIAAAPGMTIHYAETDEKTDPANIGDENWIAYEQPVNISKTDRKAVFYARATDGSGKTYYASTNGVVFDTVKPVIKINGALPADVRMTCYTTQEVTVTDLNLDEVRLNGVAKTLPIKADGNAEKIYLIRAEDRAGNLNQLTIYMKPIEKLDDTIEDMTVNNMDPKNADKVEAVQEEVQKLYNSATVKAEKDLLKEILDKCDALLEINYTITTKEDNLKWTTGTKKTLIVAANGKDAEFEELLIDGDKVATTNFTHKSTTTGTSITLKYTYLEKLKTGDHTIQVVYEDGKTNVATLEILNSNPKTGDNSHLVIWCLAAGFSAAGLAVAVLTDRKRRYQA